MIRAPTRPPSFDPIRMLGNRKSPEMYDRRALPAIACLCCTYRKPRQLANIIDCFNKFEYPIALRSLWILDDAGQYPTQPAGPGWRVVSVRDRASTLGQKRNLLASLAPSDVDAFVVIDDDDAYLPWTLLAHAHALSRAKVSRPAWVFNEEEGGRLALQDAIGHFHAAWAYERNLFLRAGGYPSRNCGEDKILWRRLERAGGSSFDATAYWPPYFVHRWKTSGGPHLSGFRGDGYKKMAEVGENAQPVVRLEPASLGDIASQAHGFLGARDSSHAEIRRRWRGLRPANRS